MKLSDHLPVSLRITRGHCPICHTVGVLVLQENSLTEPLTCNKGHLLTVGVPGLADVEDDLDEEGYGSGI